MGVLYLACVLLFIAVLVASGSDILSLFLTEIGSCNTDLNTVDTVDSKPLKSRDSQCSCQLTLIFYYFVRFDLLNIQTCDVTKFKLFRGCGNTT